jgi:hypothetical protein
MKVNVFVMGVDGGERVIHVQGRAAWALLELIRAGTGGCTPIDNPAPRWSGYVHKLRRVYGLDIETMHESHGGPFPGRHARYVLHSRVRIEPADNGMAQAA